MSEKRNVPQLRFPGFGESWRDQTLGQLLEFKNGYNASRERYGSGEKFINVLDIIQNATITHEKILGSVEVSKSDFEKYKVEFGDILFQRSSETREEVGQANVYLDKTRPATFGGFVIRGKKVGDFVPPFMNYLLRTPQSRNEITSKSGGSTRYNVGQDILSQVPVVLPSLPEQQKIAEFLTVVDRRIELLQAKKEKLEAYKKGVLQKVFSKKLRFKADDGSDFPDWEERKLGEVGKFYGGGTPDSFNEKLWNGTIPWISSSDIGENSIFDVSKTRFISEEAIIFSATRLVPPKSVLIVTRVGVGKIAFSETSVCTSQDFTSLTPTEEFDPVFLAYKLFTMAPKIKSLSQGTSIKGVTSEEIKNIKIFFPNREEQEKIVQFLTSLDKSIETLNQQINHTQTWKKGLLQKMFV